MRTPGPTDPSARQPGPPRTEPPLVGERLTVGDLTSPGPTRSQALRAMEASLKTDVGLCGERCASAARNALDAGLGAAGRLDP